MINFDAVKADLKKYEANILGICYDGLIHDVPRMRILQNLRKETKNMAQKGALNAKETNFLLNEAVKIYTKVYKTSFLGLRKAKKAMGSINYQEYLKTRQKEAFDAIDKKEIWHSGLHKACQNVVFRLEAYAKKMELSDLLSSHSVFYACSFHESCANDHAQYQGKIYYDANWEKFITAVPEKEKIKAYIRNHHLLSIQSVTQGPPYLLTRPNCKHYFLAVPTGEVLTSSARKILVTHKLIVKESLPHDVKRSAAKYAWRAYTERLEQYKFLQAIMPGPGLAQKIKDTERLALKWREAMLHEQ